MNEWLIREGYLVLQEYPDEITPFEQLKVDWSKSRVWSAGGYYARIFINVKGREPEGVVESALYESFREELREKLESTLDEYGPPSTR